MITSLKFENFRGLTDLTISPLKRINLVAGANNTGKTGVLEGLYLLFSGEQQQFVQFPSVFRSNVSGQQNQHTHDDFPTFWQSLFYDKQTDVPARISAKIDSGSEQTCVLSTVKNANITILHEKHGVGSPSAIGISISG